MGEGAERGEGVYSPTIALIANAWTRPLVNKSPNAAFTALCRATRLSPAKAVLSTSTEKCDSPLPSSPIWPLWLALSFETIRRVGDKASVRRVMISASIGPFAFVLMPPI